MFRLPLSLFLALAPLGLFAQAPGVPIYTMGKGSQRDAPLLKQCKTLLTAKALLPATQVDAQLTRTTCTLALPPAGKTKLESRQLWARARQTHLLIGWYYLCKKCERWHLDLAGGYAITQDSAATCGHLLNHDDMKEAYLIAIDDQDHVIPVTEVLAFNRATDSAILRLKTDQLTPLPLSLDVIPGDKVYCFSDPIDRRGFYSEGIVNQFIKRPFLRPTDFPAAERAALATIDTPIWLTVSSDWAPGSSGSALLDTQGNAIGHVSEIQSILEDPVTSDSKKNVRQTRGTVIIFHDAIAASNIRALISAP